MSDRGTPWGPSATTARRRYVVDPRCTRFATSTLRLRNPWCYVFNEWGQGICGDGTGANQHWDTPSPALSIAVGVACAVFPTEGMRPVVGSEFLVTRQFPDDVQGSSSMPASST